MQKSILVKLRQARNLQPLDDKKLASWNALVLNVLLKADAYKPNAEIRSHIQKLYRFIRKTL